MPAAGNVLPAGPHPLDPLLRPRSVAVVGASRRADSMGEWCMKNLERGGFGGAVYPVNPGYETLFGHRCYASLSALPQVPDLVMFAVSDARIEAVLDEAIALGVPAVLLMSTLALDDESDDGAEPVLKERVRAKIAQAGLLACGANGMGFYNVRDRVWACGFDSRMHEPPGKISLISHSGSGMSGLIDCEERMRINFAVSTGNELGVTMDRYLDFVLDLPETRAVGLFVETARDPAGFRAALAKAADKDIPVVALKVGRTLESARLAVSHSGAMAGDDATYDALFDRYGVTRVRDMDELATVLILMAELHPVGPGGLVTLHDSGGERQLMVDLAGEAGVALTRLSAESVGRLEAILDPALPAVNPLDAWSRGGESARDTMAECLSIMLQDPGAAMGAVVHDRAPDGLVYPSYIGYMRRAHAAAGKPVALVAARQGTGCDRQVVEATHAGLPVLDGIPAFLRGVRALFDHRDRRGRPPMQPPAANEAAVTRWAGRLAAGGTLDEAESLALLRDFGLPASDCRIVDSEEALVEAAGAFGYPLVLKTAAPGILHKSDRNGVHLGLQDDAALRSAYRDLAARLGRRALVAPMAEAGLEMILGARRDPQFGPVVLLGFGGVYAEILKDVAFALPPFDAACARRRIDGLRLRPLLDGQRGRPPCAIDAFCEMAARFSALVHALREQTGEIDLNPVIVGRERCIAVDALIAGHQPDKREVKL